MTWTGPGGAISFYRVYWRGGNSSNSLLERQESTNITALIPGVRYNITVCAVATDNHTEGNDLTISVYTSKCTFKLILHREMCECGGSFLLSSFPLFPFLKKKILICTQSFLTFTNGYAI